MITNTAIDDGSKKLPRDSLCALESELNADVLTFHFEIGTGVDDIVKMLIEEISTDADKHDTLFVILTTPGGSLNPLKRIVTVFRHFYNKVNFIIPDYAYSAGTILALSGDEIWMNYYSALGPVDPQVQTKDGHFVAALGYLDKVNEMIEKAKTNDLTNAEFMILRDQDLAQLREFEQARDLAVDLIEGWLVTYKFRDWTQHKDGRPVTANEKTARAHEIASKLGNNNNWKSHSRPISMQELEEMHLKIHDYYEDKKVKDLIENYYGMVIDYMRMKKYQSFVQTRRHV